MGDIQGFYFDVLTELVRIMREGAILVMLIGRKDLADAMTANFESVLCINGRYEILVNGKKASVIRWIRQRATTSLPYRLSSDNAETSKSAN